MHYQLILVDLGGVVVDFDSDRLVHQAAQLIGRPFDEVQKVVYHDDLLLPFELGQVKPLEYYEGLKAKLKLPWSYEQFVRIWNDIFTENPDMAVVLERLRQRHKLLALTNTNTLHITHMKATIPALALFHDWIASCDVGLRKPDPKIYQLALERGGARPEFTVYIDDRPELVEAGRRAGLTAIRFENGQQLEHDLRQIGINI